MMEFYRFDAGSGEKVSHFDSDFVLSRIVRTDSAVNIGCMHLGANGVVGYHQTAAPQLLLVVSGQGAVRSGEESVRIGPGDAVFWTRGEWHETTSEQGLTALVIESAELDPARYMPSRSMS
ncbi:cupin domain-containing protein [Microbacterium sp. zg-Y818]|uniref:cupin domain-containing protein n=1 Tax=unclassified Microbacterium TaxID=2609290 RepID=UPI00214D109C|nr:MULTISPECIES: cupin domain-containing protein [unclassified Microbacterium]MCR2799455.1 cupin domain-containing protein [Microbacterium sp. zg.Y818]WIM21452.1 cupin domain-containing protein [Microbacterium sp. zg-Y818]